MSSNLRHRQNTFIGNQSINRTLDYLIEFNYRMGRHKIEDWGFDFDFTTVKLKFWLFTVFFLVTDRVHFWFSLITVNFTDNIQRY